MATIIFKLGHSTKENLEPNKKHSIYLRYKQGRNFEFRASTKIKVLPKFWDDKKQKPKNKSEFIQRIPIENKLKQLREYLIEFETNFKSRGETPTKDQLKKHFKRFFDTPETKVKPKNLFDYIKEFKDRPDILKTRSKGTIKNYKLTENFLQRFNDEVYPIDFDNIDMDFYNDFVEWAESLNLTKNYIGKHINTLKTFMNNATDDKVNSNLEFKNRRFKVLKEDAQNIYLTLDELNEIYKKDFSHLPRLDQARDLFLIGAYTGLRVSDFNYLKPENIFQSNGKDFLRKKVKKGKKDIVIPLRPEVKAILKKHGNKPPKRMPDQHINKEIKNVCENAGIDDIVFKEQTRGGKKIITKYFKYQMVGTHTGRRSFCTNAYLSGMPTIDIMQISGHSSEKIFLNYIKADALQRAEKISEHPFFKSNSNNLKVVSNN